VTAPIVATNLDVLFIALVVVAALAWVGIFVQMFQARRAARDLDRAMREFRPDPRDLRVPRAPDTASDYRDSLTRHARELQLKENRR
jgi:hypothetical protein